MRAALDKQHQSRRQSECLLTAAPDRQALASQLGIDVLGLVYMRLLAPK